MEPTRIVVAEDNEIIRAGIRELLSQAPEFNLVAEARDGREAIALATSLQPDLMLMDLRMPEVDGASAAKQITAKQPNMKIVVVTADDSQYAERLAQSVGAAAVVTKDQCVHHLIPTLRSVVQGVRLFGENEPEDKKV